MTILDAIKKGLKAAGVNEKYATKVQKLFKIEKEEEIDTYISLFKDNILPDIEDTSAVEKAKKDAITEYEKKNGLKDGKPIEKLAPKGKKTKKAKDVGEEEEEEEEDDLSDLPPAYKKLLKAQQKQIETLADGITTLTKTVTDSGKTGSARKLFDDSKLPEKWFKRIDVNSETSVEDQIKELQEEYSEIRQTAVTEEVDAGNYRPYVAQPKDRTEKEWKEFMDKEEVAGETSGIASLGIE